MAHFKGNIEDLTEKNTYFRQVIFTGIHSQLVLMCLKPAEEIGLEVHDNIDQFFRFEEGRGKVIIGDSEYEVGDGDAVVVPAGSNHNVINTSASEDLKLYTIYSPPQHPDATVHKTRQEAIVAEEHE